ncbi:MAG: hypothetical protein JO250_05710 [Armatimonadetes bacterium]|nr:hypothetical protein [Armatimonadota bacterium]
MELWNTLRWDEIIGSTLTDPSCRILAAVFLLLLVTACACHWLYDPLYDTAPQDLSPGPETTP